MNQTPRPKQCPCTLLDLSQAGEFLKMPKSTIYKLTSTRQIPFLKPAKHLMFCEEHLSEWLMKFYYKPAYDY
jgi:excisionase family DNA binding protein